MLVGELVRLESWQLYRLNRVSSTMRHKVSSVNTNSLTFEFSFVLGFTKL